MSAPRHANAGFTLIEVLIGLAILGIVSSSIYQAYGNVLQIVQASQYNSAALNIIESNIETVRNMRYEDIGTVGGIPSGKLPQTTTVTLGSTAFTLHAYVRNIDDSFDGTLGGTPNDTSPADYKMVQFQVTCNSCGRYSIVSMATYVAPKNLESSSKRGNLFVKVFDANGVAVPGATIHITNTKVSPQIDLTDTTNADGILQLVDTATTSAGYHITATKAGYTSDQTYPPGTPANPIKPDATVASQQLTITSLSIDHTSTLSVRTRDQFCQAVPGMDFLLTGARLIGTSPNTPAYSTAQTTDAAGTFLATTLAWDTYKAKPTDTVLDIAGTTASLSFVLNPNATKMMTWRIASHSGSALLVKITDGSGTPVDDATVQMTQTGFSATSVTGRSSLTQTDWSAGKYDSKSSGIDTETTPGMLTLAQVGGKYATGSEEWLISRTFDMGSTSTNFFDLAFTPTSQPAQTMLRFQVAANTDNATWNWLGPDGTPASYFTTSGQTTPASLGSSRYFRYKALLKTDNAAATPTLSDMGLDFRSGCLPSGQAYINGLSNGIYTLTVTKSGFQPYSAAFTISSTWQETTVTLQP
jgi:prepilin-type N-terminal cleavage/methylation domain-containing protein